MRLRATFIYEYEADPQDYETFDPVEAARIDQTNFRDSPSLAAVTVQPEEIKSITVEPVTT